MAATTAMCTSFKVELFKAQHNFLLSGGNTFKAALIKVGMAGTYGAASTNYSNITGNSDEVANGSGYTTGGGTLTRIDPTSSGTTAFCDFADFTWSTASFSATAVMIYNSTSSNQAVSIHDFGGTKTASGGDFQLQFPTADASNAILRLA